MRQVLMINVVGTFAVTKAFLPMLKSGNKKTIVNISSDAACLTLMYSMIHAKDGMDAGMGLSYKASKVAVNMGEQLVPRSADCSFCLYCIHSCCWQVAAHGCAVFVF